MAKASEGERVGRIARRKESISFAKRARVQSMNDEYMIHADISPSTTMSARATNAKRRVDASVGARPRRNG